MSDPTSPVLVPMDDDIPRLKEAGIAEIFTPGTALDAIVQWVEENVKSR